MSANGDIICNGKCDILGDHKIVKTESCCCSEMQCAGGVDLSNHKCSDQSAERSSPKSEEGTQKPSDEMRQSATSREQLSGDSSPADRNSFDCQQCNSQFGTFEQFIRNTVCKRILKEHMRTAHLHINDDGSMLSSSSASVKCQCHICGRQLGGMNKQMEFNTHLAEHLLDTKTQWHCQKCHGKQFDGINDLRQHLAQFHSHAIFRCAICLELFAESDDLEDHLMAHHSVKRQKFLCVACEMPFDSRLAFELHIGQMHCAIGQMQQSQTHHFRYEQPQSKSTGISSSRHQQLRRKEAKKRESNRNGTVPKSAKFVKFASSTVPPQKGLKCVVCDVECVDELSLDKHRLFEHCKVRHGDRCGVCRRPLDTLAAFVDHSMAHRNPLNDELHCVVCRQLIRGDAQLQMHGQYHLSVSSCRRRNDGTDNAKNDNDNDSGDDGDGNGADDDGLLDKDDDKADGEEQPTDKSPLATIAAVNGGNFDGISTPSIPPAVPTIKCSSCDMNVSSADDYAKHLLLHAMVGSLVDFGTLGENGGSIGNSQKMKLNQNGQLPMRCARCGRMFDTFVALNSHMLEHLREQIGEGRFEPSSTNCPEPIRCDKCRQTFASMRRFVVHRRRHKMERTLAKCRICDRHFANKAQLDEHTSEHSAKLQMLMAK